MFTRHFQMPRCGLTGREGERDAKGVVLECGCAPVYETQRPAMQAAACAQSNTGIVAADPVLTAP
ncbi:MULTISPECIES: hypothetical protein [unclassified Sphingomonas]|uniref:hypothetical protein n=1 Tax=unclassified Sphingomonas TaxID=196159 RepID=UPI00226A2C31|nr:MULTISPECIES: hypothetical protein [unclassified Sphingomonas]